MAEKTVVGEVVYKVSLDQSEFDKEVKQVESSAQSMGDKTSSGAQKASLGVDGLKSSITGLVATAASLTAVTSGISTVTNAYSQYEAAMNGVKSVASATGNGVAESMQVIKDSTANGLLSEADTAAAVKNLELYGYTAQQAGEMIKVLTDSAAYNRQSNYSLSEAVRVTTEGIRMENSVLSDAAGIQKNIAKMYEDYASQIGKSSTALTQAEKAQAVYNGVMEEGKIFAGDAASYSNTLAGSQQTLEQSIVKVEQALGSMFNIFAPIISGIAEFIENNKAMVAGLVAATATILGAGGVIVAIKTVIPLIKSLALAISGTLGPLGLLLGVGAAVGAMAVASTIKFDDYSSSVDDYASSANNAANNTEDLADETIGLGVSAGKTQKQIAKLQKQIEEVYDNYKKDLKKIKDSHEETIADLTKQIEDANRDYIQAVNERNAAFLVTEDEQKRKHQEKVDALTQQLNFLQRYNNKYNQEKLAQVQFALQKEQALYEKETADRKAELDVQNAADKASLERRLTESQKELDEELAFMEKHRAELDTVRDLILDDEVVALQKRRDKELVSLQEQVNNNTIYGNDAGAAFKDAYIKQLSQIPDNTKDIGKDAGTNLSDGLIESVGNHLSQGGIVGDIWRTLLGDERYYRWTHGDLSWNNPSKRKNGGSGWAEGGYTGRGNADEVAGIVHKGEYVLPQEMVDQTTGTPKLGSTVNITVNASGLMAISEQEKRRVGMELANSISQVFKARSLA